ncbi:hypothetical protein M878_09360 [Streptomyces roseochromogenus subsp. oscitans DS 12.976]|uniref:Uncharacterized protein n=1 Tax=Streptomyces roseochromogenus subsp. oscitans DS 12.976 TaxID=1352936 RepID=V6KRJ1_STRRC|nr:hypothetical protein M878_09360 [Streptomyces roseochromogenus subsp. oscitans DS 12.976]
MVPEVPRRPAQHLPYGVRDTRVPPVEQRREQLDQKLRAARSPSVSAATVMVIGTYLMRGEIHGRLPDACHRC